jgi:copper resistance protein B
MIRLSLLLSAMVLPVPAVAQMDHSQMDHSMHREVPEAGHVMGSELPPPPPSDHAADRIYDPAEMATARQMLAKEAGGMSASMIIVERAEYQMRNGSDGYRWEAEGWFGGDIDRFAFKTEGEGNFGNAPEQAELQALYSHALDPWFNLQLGLRHDIRPDPSRTYAVLGVEGLAPYWFEVGGALFLSDKGDMLARAQMHYDQRITQELILQPSAELNFAAQNVPENGVGSGLSNLELGLRLRYEIIPEFAPYVGLSYERKTGDSANYARAAGEDVSSTSFVAGVRFWF